MSTSAAEYLKWPGKSPVEEGGIFHPAAYHMLDVGAVLSQLLRQSGFSSSCVQALTLLGVLHDIGKINSEFKLMIESGVSQSKRHWEVSMAWFEYFDSSLLKNRLGNEFTVRRSLYAAAAGHHGGSPSLNGRQNKRMIKRAGDDAKKDAQTFISEIFELFPEASLEGIGWSEAGDADNWRRSSNAVSWWFSGVLSVSDWIGSNVEWFPAREPSLDIQSYWKIANDRARHALVESGLLAATVSNKPASSLFQFGEYTPMQKAVLEVAIPDGSALIILEDATGSGKTEAALLLAQRMMQQEKGEGVFFALPTMATSNAMFGRLASLKRMFTGTPSIALTHSHSNVHEGFEKIINANQFAKESDSEMTCTDWFADGRRKSLLAQIGVGTIDQALLGVLPTRFCSLRLYALSQKILIIDEAHDYDPYMQRELEALLSFQAMLGGSVILMTATLPMVKRRKLIQAYQNKRDEVEGLEHGNAYPQMTVVGSTEQVMPIRSHGLPEHSRVEVQRIGSVDEVVKLLVEAAGSGSACACIRNSVDEAIAVAEVLRGHGVNVLLHHARFVMRDRLLNEKRLLDRFGKEGKGRQGWVVVGTQVLEQSLDIDFDVMVSDLAPIGALIQRAGRLWRHKNLRSPEQRGVEKPVLHVLAPDPTRVNDDKWAHAELGAGWYVYSLSLIWRTAKVLFDEGVIISPCHAPLGEDCGTNIRSMIDSIEGEIVIEVPQEIQTSENKDSGQAYAERALGQMNVLNSAEPYMQTTSVFEDEHFPTRLGEEQIVLRLAQWMGEDLVPLADLQDQQRAWILSEISISKKRWMKFGDDEYEHSEIQRLSGELKDWQKNTFKICPVDDEGSLANADMIYHPLEGLRISQQ